MFGYSAAERRRRVQITFDRTKSKTRQQYKADADINNIMAKYIKTGMLSHVNRYNGQYADVTGLGDYQESMNMIRTAQDMFMTLPAKVRSRFNNDPGEFLAFVDNPDNRDELVALGLARKPAPESGAPPSGAPAAPVPAPATET